MPMTRGRPRLGLRLLTVTGRERERLGGAVLSCLPRGSRERALAAVRQTLGEKASGAVVEAAARVPPP